MAKVKPTEKQERDRLKAMADSFPAHRAYIIMVAICRPIETVQAVRDWLENKQ